MSDEESRALELRVLENRDAFEEVMAAEDELIDEYLDGVLPPEQRSQFERVYTASPDRRARVEFARALREKLGRDRLSAVPVRIEPARPARPSPTVWLAAAAALFAAIGAFLAVDSARLRREVGRLEAEKASAVSHDAEVSRQVSDLKTRSERLERDLQGQKDEAGRLADQLATLRAQGGRVVSFLLATTLTRESGQLQTLKVPADAATVRLTIPFAPGTAYASYRAVVQSPEGKSYWAGTGSWPPPGAKSMAIHVPASALPAGDYILSLTGVTAAGNREPAADFSFRVVRG